MNPFSKPQTKDQPASPNLAFQGEALEAQGTKTDFPISEQNKPKIKLPFAKILVAGIIILITLFSFGLIGYLILGQNKTQTITTYEECVAAGYPIMESYPEQCAANGKTFTREFTEEEQKNLDPDPTNDLTISINEDSNTKKITNTKLNHSFDIPATAEFTYDTSPGFIYKIYPFEKDNKQAILVYNYGSSRNLQEIEEEIVNGDFHRNEPLEISKSYIMVDGFEALKYNYAMDDKTSTVVFVNNERNPNEFEITAVATDQNKLIEILPVFDQILSTFKFTDASEASSVDTSTWKTFTSEEFEYSIKYPNDWIVYNQSYKTDFIEHLGFAIQGPSRSDVAGANGEKAHYIRSLEWDSKTKTLVANTAFGKTGEQFHFEKQPGDQAPKAVNVDESFILNSGEHFIGEKIISTFKFTK